MEAKTVKERLIRFLKFKGLNKKVFEEKAGLSNGYVGSIRVGIGSRALLKIEKTFPELSTHWLLTGEGEMLKTGDSDESNARFVGEVFPASQRDSDVSLVDFIPVSAHATFIEGYPCAVELDQLPVILRPEEKSDLDSLKIFEVEGDSMIPTIQPGAMVLTKLIPECRWHYAEGVVVAAYDDFVVLKRVIRNELLTPNRIILGSDNERYGEMTVAAADIRALFKAKRILSQDIY